MRERPILFSAAMVRALLDGSKTQTRRAIVNRSRVHPELVYVRESDGSVGGWWPYLSDDGESFVCDGMEHPVDCPYGKPGDLLWVRETWAQNQNQLSDTRMDCSYVYRADGEERAQDNGTDLPWRPSIHMPRWASRIDLKVTGVRVERLQGISASDALQEGLEECHDLPYRWDHPVCFETAQRLYSELWEQINGAGTWAANPWVWVVEFRRVRP
jgi:hypothetical protein